MTFEQLQQATRDRGWLWGNVDLDFRFIELGGEAGEALNAYKKYLRYCNGMPGGVADLEPIADELADVIICAVNVANEFGMDVSDIVARKFNKTSEKHGFPQRL